MRNIIYQMIRAEEESDNIDFRKARQRLRMYILPQNTLKIVSASRLVARELLGECHQSYSWQATIVVDDVWNATSSVKPAESWLKSASFCLDFRPGCEDGSLRLLRGRPAFQDYNVTAQPYDYAIRKVSFKRSHDIPADAIARAKRAVGFVKNQWRIFASVDIELDSTRTPPYSLQVATSIP